MSEDFEILYSDSKESGSHHSHHHSDGTHHHGSHHHGSHRHSKQRKRRKRILIITLSIVACLLIVIGVGGAYGYKVAKREVSDVKQQAYTLKADLKSVMAGLKAQDPVATETACDQLDVAIDDINKTFDKKYGRQLTKSLNSKDISILSKNFLISFRKLPQILHVQQLLYLMTILFQDLKLMMASA